ncbi:hypothetical protein ABXS75_11415 [Roseburia hominis]
MIFDVFMVIWLWRLNGRNAIANGQKPGKYQALTLLLWYGLEILGSLLGATLVVMIDANANPMVGAYMVGLPGAILGGYISYRLARYAPKGDYHPDYSDQPWNPQNPLNPWNRELPGQSNDVAERQASGGMIPVQNMSGELQRAEMLSHSATVRIIEDNRGYSGGKDAFFLNGTPVCMLGPGEEYTFSTRYLHNMITIGRPGRTPSEKEYAVRFIAEAGGYIEVHASTGKLLPELFKNFKSV